MLAALIYLLFRILDIIELLVIGRIIVSWVDADPTNTIVRILRETTEPLFRLVRPIARKIPGPLDWSGVIILLGIEFIKHVLASWLR
jgi:YggT family protein